MRIFYNELSNYNNGRLVGRWFDLDGMNYDDHQQEINDWLESLPGNCEEYCIGDAEGAVEGFLGCNYSIDAKFWDYMEAADNSYLEFEVFVAAGEADICPDEVEDRFRGEWESDEDFAWNYIDETGMLDNIPEQYVGYFDVKAFARDLMMDFVEVNGYYFFNH